MFLELVFNNKQIYKFEIVLVSTTLFYLYFFCILMLREIPFRKI